MKSEFVYSFLDLVDLYINFEKRAQPFFGAYKSKVQLFSHLIEIINDTYDEDLLYSLSKSLNEVLKNEILLTNNNNFFDLNQIINTVIDRCDYMAPIWARKEIKNIFNSVGGLK